MQLYLSPGTTFFQAKGGLAVVPVIMTYPMTDTVLSSELTKEPNFIMGIIQSQGISLWATTQAVQKVGETILIASLLIAFLQAVIALFQYRTNPAGELVIPPGPTVGIARPNQRNTGLYESSFHNTQTDATSSLETNMSEALSTSAYARNINRINRILFLLLPLAVQQVAFIFSRSMHVLHIGFILTLVKLFDVPAAFFAQHETHPVDPLRTTNTTSKRDIERVLVIGDSLAVGLGTVNVFDANKNQSIDYQLYQNLDSSPSLPSPAFPQALAGCLAGLSDHPVSWRSAGVDGGTVVHIRDLCLPVLEQEVQAGRAPDCVVILCGLNDLKKVVANPLKPLTPKDFRGLLNDLILEIRRLSPGSKVVLPALPTQMIHYNSPLNIFPLLFFIDMVVGFWESQKKVVVDTFPSNDVMYVPLSKAELESWYAPSMKSDVKENMLKAMEEGALIAIDGVHPNARCYSRWGQSVGRYLFRVSR
jgi:lysophospholipase L1-like esterase